MIKELTKIEKLLDVFSMNICILTLIIGLNELSRRTFQFHKDKYLIALVGFTGKAVQIQIILNFLSNIFGNTYVWVLVYIEITTISFARALLAG